jgi:nucleotide-binding universal stress UspA family protein
MIKNIMVGFGGSRGAQVALRQALDIAGPASARLHLTQVENLSELGPEVELLPGPVPEATVLSIAEDTAPTPEEEEAGLTSGKSTPVLEMAADICRGDNLPYTLNRVHGDPGQRLLSLSRLHDLVVVGRRGDERRYRTSVLGRTARRLALGCVTPTLFADREHLPVTSATVLYEPQPGGNWALARAAELCSLLNATLNVVCVGYQAVTPEQALAEAGFALRAYHLDGELIPGSGSPAESLQSAALLWASPLLVIPAPPRRGWWTDHSLTHAALAAPGTNVLLVP